MTRTKKAGQKKTGKPVAAPVTAAGPSQPIDVQSLIGMSTQDDNIYDKPESWHLSPDKAHTLLAQSNFELAIKFLTRAIEHEPGNLEAREVLGVAELEGGDEDSGREVSSLSSLQIGMELISSTFFISSHHIPLPLPHILHHTYISLKRLVIPMKPLDTIVPPQLWLRMLSLLLKA
jgi:hypothetical protein